MCRIPHSPSPGCGCVIEIAGYRVIDLIGRGATASVYHAVQLSLEREVAIKVLHPELAADSRAAARFLDEARLLAGLSHPHVVSVWDVGVSSGGLHYFSMRHLPGGNLAGRMAAGAIPEESLARIIFGVAKALEYIHARGLLHRDVTPGNILFDGAGAPYLTDFGVARNLVGVQRAALADLAPAVVRYASPELLRGAAMDHRADLYSLGVLTYEALCGKPPFEVADAYEMAYAHVFEPAPPLPLALSRWQPLIDQALAKLPESRMPGAGAFAAMVERSAPEHASGLNMVIRAPHLEHIRTVPPEEQRRPSGPPPAAARLDAMPTQISKRPPTAEAQLPAAGGVRRHKPLLLVGIASLLLGVLAFAILWFRPISGGSAQQEAVAKLAAQAETTAATPPEAPVAVEIVAIPDTGDQQDLASDDQDLDPSDLPTVLDPVAELIRRGRQQLAARRLMLPAGDSAHDSFRQALAIDPTAVGAQRGLVDIGRVYLELADAAATIEERLAFWERGLLATDGLDTADDVRLRIVTARVKERDVHLADAHAALARWDGDAARMAFEQALVIDGEAPGAVRGLAEADRVGKPGFRFVDSLGQAGPGPELVIVGAFALATHPVTVAEFRRFWADQGAALDGQRLSCRDRESGWRASRRRTWEEPGFAQGPDHPVVCVSHAEALAFADWLSQASGKRYRLPTAAEWQAAYAGPAPCSAANRGDQRFRQRHGGRNAQPCDDGFAETSPVASFAAVGVGLYDMDGNVREWSSDCAVEGRDGCRERLALGSAWLSVDEPEPVLRPMNSEVVFNSVGFRVLRELE